MCVIEWYRMREAERYWRNVWRARPPTLRQRYYGAQMLRALENLGGALACLK